MISDGGSNQEECSYLGKPCLLLRESSERVEGLDSCCVLSHFDQGVINQFLSDPVRFQAKPVSGGQGPSHVVLNELAVAPRLLRGFTLHGSLGDLLDGNLLLHGGIGYGFEDVFERHTLDAVLSNDFIKDTIQMNQQLGPESQTKYTVTTCIERFEHAASGEDVNTLTN